MFYWRKNVKKNLTRGNAEILEKLKVIEICGKKDMVPKNLNHRLWLRVPPVEETSARSVSTQDPTLFGVEKYIQLAQIVAHNFQEQMNQLVLWLIQSV